jgi:folate-binding protein YgfZ
MAERLPLHDAHVAAGATLETPCDWELPLAYGDAAAEYAAARRAVGLVDRGHHGVLEVRGRDRAGFLHALLSNDIKRLGAGEGCAATLLDVHGKVQVIVLVWTLDDRILIVTPPGRAAFALEALDNYLFSEKVELRDATGELALLLLVGPEAPALAERLTGARPSETPWTHGPGSIDGHDVRVVRGGGETGDPEVWLACAAARGRDAWEHARAAGARPIGLTAFESLRIEAGTPLLGHDVDSTVLLPEIPFQHLLSYSKGCYPGQEVIVRIRDRGHVNRMLRGLRIDGEAVPPPGAEVLGAGAVVGKVTSATWSFGLGTPIALALVRRAQAEPGTRVAVRAADRTWPASVSALPFSR